MKLLATLTALLLSFALNAQDLKFKICGSRDKKWIGSTVYATSLDENFSELTFYKNLSVVESNRKYKTKKPATTWKIVSGEYINDASTILMIGNRRYNVEFSTTNNGREFMTLTYTPESEDEAQVIKTFYAE